MRPVGLGDLAAAAGALAAVPAARRAGLMARLLAEAAAADRFRRRWGRCHPRLGNGTLMAAALRHPQRPPAPGCPDGFAALAVALAAVRAAAAAADPGPGGGRALAGQGLHERGWHSGPRGLS